jgi:hypothetical protein
LFQYIVTHIHNTARSAQVSEEEKKRGGRNKGKEERKKKECIGRREKKGE